MRMPIKPMLAKLAPESDALFARHGMSWEPKYDGYRLVAEGYGPDRPAVLWARSGNRCTESYPEFAAALQNTTTRCVLDGEVVVVIDGRPSFNGLQLGSRMTKPQREERLRYVVFDVLEVDGVETIRMPYTERRALMLDTVQRRIVSPYITATPASEDGAAMWHAMELAKMEGMIGKPLGSRYLFGERGTWLKLKRKAIGEFAVVGWTWGKEGVTGSRLGEIGALVLAIRQPDGSLVYAGKVGTGFDGATLRSTKDRLEAMRGGEPFQGAEAFRARRLLGAEPVVWVDPVLTAVVEYAEMSKDGIPRFPSFKGMR